MDSLDSYFQNRVEITSMEAGNQSKIIYSAFYPTKNSKTILYFTESHIFCHIP